jgi:hypothetical protein
MLLTRSCRPLYHSTFLTMPTTLPDPRSAALGHAQGFHMLSGRPSDTALQGSIEVVFGPQYKVVSGFPCCPYWLLYRIHQVRTLGIREDRHPVAEGPSSVC